MEKEKFGERLKRLRKQKNLSVSSISEYVGVSQSTYRDWEYGREIKGQPYQRLCEKLDVTLNYLITGKKWKIEEYLCEIEENVKMLRRCL